MSAIKCKLRCSHLLLFSFILSICWCCVVVVVDAHVVGLSGSANLTEFLLQRQKRFVIFQNGGNIKLVVGPILPIDTGDPVPWRNLLILYNIQGMQYDLPTTPLYPWDKWEELFARSLQMPNEKGQQQRQQPVEDDTRLFVYLALEHFLNARSNGHGRACLLRSICENAQVHQHVGIFTEILNIVLTPGKEKRIASVYRQAHMLGHSGIDCFRLFPACPMGANFLDPYLHEL